MSIETGVIIDLNGNPLYWHLPPGRTSIYLPDSRDFWNVIYENRDRILGFAHSHPGNGTPAPSWEDLTSFSAIELGLGRLLDWWIISQNEVIKLKYSGKEKYNYLIESVPPEFKWLDKLKHLSYGDNL